MESVASQVASSLNNLAVALQAAGELHEADSLSEEALRIRRTTLGVRHIKTLTSLINRASILYSLATQATRADVNWHSQTIEPMEVGSPSERAQPGAPTPRPNDRLKGHDRRKVAPQPPEATDLRHKGLRTPIDASRSFLDINGVGGLANQSPTVSSFSPKPVRDTVCAHNSSLTLPAHARLLQPAPRSPPCAHGIADPERCSLSSTFGQVAAQVASSQLAQAEALLLEASTHALAALGEPARPPQSL